MNMKKYCLVTILLSVLMSMPLSAYDFVQNGIYYDIEGDHVSVTYSGNGVYTGSVSIPNQVTYNGVTYPVTAIGEWAFEGGEGMTYLSIPSSITSIGEYAFIDCGSNIEVRIADLTAWCKVEFGNVHSSPLSSAKKFYLNTSSYETKSLSIPNGVEAISNFAFYQCRSITSLSIAGSVKTIGSSTFEDCTGLTSISLNNGLESIGGSSFEGCKGLSTVKLPSSVKSIAINAFKNCTSLTSLTLNEGIESIGISSFEGCTGISAITLPSSLMFIDINAFSGCSKLNVIVSRIQDPFPFVDNVFSTYSTATVIVPDGTTTSYQLIDGWNLFDNITDDPSQDPTKRTIHVATAGTLPSLISADAMFLIEELTLSGELNGTDFRFIRRMAGIDFEKVGRDGTSSCDVIFKSTDGRLTFLDLSQVKIVNGGQAYLTTAYRPGTSISDYEHDDHFTKGSCISYLLFSRTNLENIILPTSVIKIEKEAFCRNLTTIEIPQKVTNIAAGAFIGCRDLASITVDPDNTIYDSRNNCNAIIEKSNNTLIAGCMNTIIPNSVISIGDNAFYGCSGLTSVTIPNGVTSIGDNAFNGCSSLTSVTIPNSVTSIGSSAFSGCSGLTSIVSLNSNPPSVTYSSTFTNVDKNNCIVWIPKGSLSAYKGANVWKGFANIFELVEGDLNLDDVVDQNDMDALVGFVMGKNPEGFYEGLADLNGDNKVDAADVVKMVDLLSASSGLGTVSQFVIENSVVSSLTCTLNNERSEAIQLTKCELYCNHNLVSYQSFSGASASVAAGGSKQCSFTNLAKYASSTGFTVCWYYTANGKNFVYRCKLDD